MARPTERPARIVSTQLVVGIDRLIRAQLIRTPQDVNARAIAIAQGRIVAMSADVDGLDQLASPNTDVIDARDLIIMPAFADAHEHLMEAARNEALVQMDGVTSIDQMVAALRERASRAHDGEWVMTAMAWHESDLAENRMPTISELDAVSRVRPVLVRRGGHLAAANSVALALAGVEPTTQWAGGNIGRNADGSPNGLLEGSAVYRVLAFAPAASDQVLIDGLASASAAYAALGVASIREAMISPHELGVYQSCAERGALSVRARPLIKVPENTGTDAQAALVDGLGVHSGFGDDILRVWGLKFVLDGGVEGGALEAPYANDPQQSGHLNWDIDDMVEVMTHAVTAGWRVGTHAAGDRAVRTILDVYERVQAAVPNIAADALVIEHALLSSPEQRARAVAMGVPITVQHTLLWNMGSEMLTTWGPERTADVNPLDDWIARGATLAVGTDLARPINPLLNVWGMATRGTRTAGVQGATHAIDPATAIDLYTRAPAQLDREATWRGTLALGYAADLTGYRDDPLESPVDALPTLTPALTLVSGRVVHDRDRRAASVST
jgi:predicted amidohydrolase YtcJ